MQLSRAADSRPNIVIILADDMGYSDIGCFGSEIPTPHLDGLARAGALHTQFYNGARCCPSRAALLTGLYAHQAGVGAMTDAGPALNPKIAGAPDSGYTPQLNQHCVTIAEALQAQGYATFQSGKWHLGSAREAWPDRRGFERTFTLVNGATNYFGQGAQLIKGNTMLWARDGQPWVPPQEGFFTTDAFADHASAFIRERSADQPFFLYLAFNAPHWPLQELPENIARFRGKYLQGWDAVRQQRFDRQHELLGMNWALSPANRAIKNWQGLTDTQRADWDERMAIYAAQVAHLDEAAGRVLATLREQEVEENTLVLFLSDNGGCAEAVDRGTAEAIRGTRESYTSYRQAWANVSNTPFRMFKRKVEEGGISTPLLARWPARIPAGTRSDQAGHVIDLLPTCLAAAGVEYPRSLAGREITPVAGVSLLPTWQGTTLPARPLFWEHEGSRAVRDGDWKIVADGKAPWELYDIAHDRAEQHNLALAQPERVRALDEQYEAWAQRCHVQPWPLRGAETRPQD